MIETNTESLGAKLSELWATADGARNRPLRSWQNAEICLDILEATGSPPPLIEEVPPDRYISLTDLIVASRQGDQPVRESYDFDAYRRSHAAKKAANRSAWIEFRRRNDLDDPPPRAA